MFTSMELDEELFKRAWSLSGKKTKRAAMEEALRVYVALHEQSGVRALRGRLQWGGNLEGMRRGRRAGPR